MKRSLIIAAVLAAFIVTALPASADVPSTRYYDVEQAAFSIAMTIMDEDASTDHHYERLRLARSIISSPGAMALKLIKMAEAKLWIDVEWTDEAPTKNQIRTNIEGVWDYVALATYGEEPTRLVEQE